MTKFVPWIKRVIAVLLLVILWRVSPWVVPTNGAQEEGYYRGIVQSVVQEQPQQTTTVQLVSVKLIEGPLKNQEIYAQNIYDPSMYGSFMVKPGTKVFIYAIMDNGKVSDAYVQDLDRLSGMITVIVAFAVIVLLVAYGKGLDALLGLLITGLFIWKIAIPMIANGYNPIWTCLLTVLVGTLGTITLVMDTFDKIILSTAGTLLGIGSAYIFGIWASHVTSVHGVTSEIFSFFQFSTTLKNLNPLSLFFGAIMIAALGATMDVAVSLVSSAREIRLQQPDIGFFQLFSSLTRIGRDMIGTMVNTLIFAYAGSELGLLVYLYSSGESVAIKYITGEFFVGDAIRAVAASAGLILAIPLTALMASAFYSGKNKRTLEKNSRNQAD
ncbi:YibE/F family protein [Coprothermobacter platensis]|uniref:YibE/F family protein n=1 Tax=Coprothermobacter platensis TaxID=108819 RepID=UPI0003720CAA|nr:YibE/F family protein [Coprothermobacter platensis]